LLEDVSNAENLHGADNPHDKVEKSPAKFAHTTWMSAASYWRRRAWTLPAAIAIPLAGGQENDHRPANPHMAMITRHISASVGSSSQSRPFDPTMGRDAVQQSVLRLEDEPPQDAEAANWQQRREEKNGAK